MILDNLQYLLSLLPILSSTILLSTILLMVTISKKQPQAHMIQLNTHLDDPVDNSTCTSSSEDEALVNGHLSPEEAHPHVKKALLRYLSETEVDKIMIDVKNKKYNPQIIRELGSVEMLQMQKKKSGKRVKIPMITPKKIGEYHISDLEPTEYRIISPLMGLIVNCCASVGGSGTMLCKASKSSPYFKMMVISDEEKKVKALTLVCTGEDRFKNKSLVILGLEVREEKEDGKKKDEEKLIYRELIQHAAQDMLKTNDYQNVLFAASGFGLAKIGFCNQKKLNGIIGQKTVMYKSLKKFIMTIAEKKNIINAKRHKIKVNDGERFGFKLLSDIPEAHICIKLAPQ